MLLEALQATIRVLYHTLGATTIEHEHPKATVRGFRFEPEDEPKRTIVLVHGLGDASTSWFRQVPVLRHEARLLLVDLPPFGTSQLHDGYALGPDAHARLLAPIVEEHAVGETTIVGQSMGGWVTQWFLHERPDLADAAVLVATAGTPLEGSYDAVELLTPHDAEGAEAYLDALWYRTPVGFPAVLGYVLERMHDPEIRGFLALTEHGHSLPEDVLAEIQTPVHVVWGQEDGLLDPGTPGYLARRWGGPVIRHHLARAGHMVHQERPGAVVSLIRQAAGIETPPPDGETHPRLG